MNITAVNVSQNPRMRDPWHLVNASAAQLKLYGEWEVRAVSPNEENEAPAEAMEYGF